MEARTRAVWRAAVLASLAAGSLAAQEPAPKPADTAAVSLPPITVTATGSSLDPFSVPLSFTVVETEQLRSTGGYGLDEALRNVPGVLAQSRSGGSDVRIVIRGFGARGAGDRSNSGTSRGIRVLVDGIPETEPDGRTAFDLIDLAAAEGIEVVRSNASAVWGNAAGGVISISTLPVFERDFLSARTVVGSFGLERYVLKGGAALGGSRVAGSIVRTSFGGWRANSAAERWLANVGLTAPLGTRTRLGVTVAGAYHTFGIPGPLTKAELDADPRQANATYLARRERRMNRLARFGLTIERRLGENGSISGMIFSTPKDLHRSERGTYREFDRHHFGGSLVYRSALALAPRVRSALVAGVDEAHQDGAIRFYSLTPDGERGGELRVDKREGANNLGVFAQGELDVEPHISLVLGARHDDITYDYRDILEPSVNRRKSFRRITPKLGLAYRPSATHTFFVSVGGGVEAPAANETDPASTFGQDTVTAINPLLEPIRSTTVEIGTRRSLGLGAGRPEAQLSYDAALYWTAVHNEMVPYRGGRFYFTAGAARRRGAELGVTLRGWHGWRARTALTFSDHRYTAYVVDSVHYGRPGRLADYSGNRVVGVPAFMGMAELAYSPPAVRPLELEIAAQGNDRYFADDANSVTVPGYVVWSLTVAAVTPLNLASGVTLRGFVSVENLTGRRYVASAFLNPDVVSGTPVAFEPGLPRSLVVSLSVSRGER